jgi:hypothetical protein
VVVGSVCVGVGCEASPRSVGWTFSFSDPGLATRAFAIEAEILEGGCSGDPLYSTLIREGVEAMAPVALPPGTVGLVGRARDSDCTYIAEACVPVELPQPDGASVVVELTPTTERDACPGECAAGICTTADAGPDAPTDAADSAVVDAAEDTTVPIDVPQPDGGCDPGTTPPSCTGDTLIECVGTMLVGTSCPLGCSGAGDACAAMVPSNLSTITFPAPRDLADVVVGDSSPDTWIFDASTGAIDAIAGFDRIAGTTSIRSAGTGERGGIVFETDSQRDGGPDVGVFVMDDLDVPAGTTLVGVGGRPLILLVRRQAIIAGTITVAADILVGERMPGPGGGAGGGRGADGSGAGSGERGVNGGGGNDGGGGGGSFGGVGGSGASGTDAAAGTTYGVQALEPLVGGSGGGGGSETSYGGQGGHGGGALQISAGTLVAIRGTGVVDACGGGGRGSIVVSSAGGGGGGGGSGGSVLLEAPTVDLDGRVGANGGSGGQGTQSPTETGVDGNRGDPTMAPVPGPASAGVGGGGGAGSDASGDASDGLVETNGGGGGGGGGRVRINNLDGSGRSGYGSDVLPNATSLFTVGMIGLD